jgi:cobalt-zinc-cadmium efflux system protein
MKEKLKEKNLKIAIYLTSIFLLVEILGGYFFGSLSLLSDAAHMFRDVFALGITFLAISLAKKLPTQTKTFGLHRAEVFVALINGLVLVGISFWIFYNAYLRILTPLSVESIGMVTLAALGAAVNFYVLNKLKVHKEDINVKSAYLHVFTDMVSSIAVVIGGIVIFFTGIYYVDTLLSIGIAFVVLISSIGLIKESANILLEGVPAGVSLDKIISEMKKVKDVIGIHHLHVWALCPNVNVLIAHVYTSKSDLTEIEKIRKRLNKVLRKFNIFHTTFQFECKECADKMIIKRIEHQG